MFDLIEKRQTSSQIVSWTVEMSKNGNLKWAISYCCAIMKFYTEETSLQRICVSKGLFSSIERDVHDGPRQVSEPVLSPCCENGLGSSKEMGLMWVHLVPKLMCTSGISDSHKHQPVTHTKSFFTCQAHAVPPNPVPLWYSKKIPTCLRKKSRLICNKQLEQNMLC